MSERWAGVLLHITSLPSRFGIGDLGPAAYRFAEYLAAAGQRCWQVLPLNPTQGSHGHSPYSSISAFAGNSLLISPELLVADGLLSADEAEARQLPATERVDYEAVAVAKGELLERAFSRFLLDGETEAYREFCREQAHWLEDFALFKALKADSRPGTWADWAEPLRRRQPEALDAERERLNRAVTRERFFQFVFFKQWRAIKDHCARLQLRIMGDIPIYVDFDSADVWSGPHRFKLDDDLRPAFVAGVPPDYFSKTGQRWGNPVYDWERLRREGFAWWLERFAHNSKLYDLVRLDHFHGFVAYWELPAAEPTAVNGCWVEAPAEDFLGAVAARFPELPIIVEDLGIITDDVRRVMQRFHLPGMKVLLFAFAADDPRHPYLPHNYERDCLVYTGTHDTNTLRGWFEEEAGEAEKERLFRYLGRTLEGHQVPRELCRLALLSTAARCVLPMQDLLGLPASARMNLPATRSGNWTWRLPPDYPDLAPAAQLVELCRTYGRT